MTAAFAALVEVQVASVILACEVVVIIVYFFFFCCFTNGCRFDLAVNWWVLCTFSIGRSNSSPTFCYWSRNWMAGYWGLAEWFLWYLHWCYSCSVSTQLKNFTLSYLQSDWSSFNPMVFVLDLLYLITPFFFCQWKYWPCWTHACWKPKSDHNFCLFHVFLLHIWWVSFAGYPALHLLLYSKNN